MPYIKQYDRDCFALELANLRPTTPGELNYLVTELALKYVDAHGMSYGAINAAIGALECAKLELYRRIAAPYEDRKIRENGDVYPEELTR